MLLLAIEWTKPQISWKNISLEIFFGDYSIIQITVIRKAVIWYSAGMKCTFSWGPEDNCSGGVWLKNNVLFVCFCWQLLKRNHDYQYWWKKWQLCLRDTSRSAKYHPVGEQQCVTGFHCVWSVAGWLIVPRWQSISIQANIVRPSVSKVAYGTPQG